LRLARDIAVVGRRLERRVGVDVLVADGDRPLRRLIALQDDPPELPSRQQQAVQLAATGERVARSITSPARM
jgi:hypothetical protein